MFCSLSIAWYPRLRDSSAINISLKSAVLPHPLHTMRHLAHPRSASHHTDVTGLASSLAKRPRVSRRYVAGLSILAARTCSSRPLLASLSNLQKVGGVARSLDRTVDTPKNLKVFGPGVGGGVHVNKCSRDLCSRQHNRPQANYSSHLHAYPKNPPQTAVRIPVAEAAVD